MALILTSSTQRKINILGTDLEISSIYLRIEFISRLNGVSMDLNAIPYASKQMYLNGIPVAVDIVSPKISKNIDPTSQSQGVDAAHALLKAYYEENGYTVAIDMN
jgi:hypothetical protein